jgi:hypothetical protein
MGKNRIIWKCVDINGQESTYEYANRLAPKQDGLP